MSVKLSLIALFIELDLDYLCAACTAPYHSFCNPAERVMSVLNLGLQSVGLARARMDDDMEAAIQGSNSVAEIRRVAAEKENLRTALFDSIAPVKVFLSTITQRLQLKEKKFTVETAAPSDSLSDLWASLMLIDSEFRLQHSDKVSQNMLTPCSKDLMFHCCCKRHYFFEIKKCGEEDCPTCFPVRLPAEEFAKIQPFPDPVLKDNGHCKPFDNVYSTVTTEEYRPFLQKCGQKRKKLPFYASVQHAKNSGMMLLCEECGMWHLIYATRKLRASEKQLLERALDGLSFLCGSPLQEADLPQELQSVVHVRNLQCHDPVESLYYSADYEDIRVYCSQELPSANTHRVIIPNRLYMHMGYLCEGKKPNTESATIGRDCAKDPLIANCEL